MDRERLSQLRFAVSGGALGPQDQHAVVLQDARVDEQVVECVGLELAVAVLDEAGAFLLQVDQVVHGDDE
eukprot:13884835-Heterocapsa_arctica.AAC.1